jgi:hypothetical protein
MTAIIQSIQPFTITPTTATTAGTAAITAVNTSMAVIFPHGCRANFSVTNQYNFAQMRYILSSSVLVSLVRPTANATTVELTGTVVEFANFVNSIQVGSITVSSGTTGGTAAINAVSTRAFIIYQGASILQAVTSYSGHLVGVKLNSSIEVGCVASPSTVVTVAQFAVVDLTSDLVAGVQQIDTEVATTSTVDVVTINAVDPARTLLIDGGMGSTLPVGSQATLPGYGYMRNLAGATSVEFIRSSSVVVTARRHMCSVVEFQAQAFATTVERNVINMTSGQTSVATTIAAVTTLGMLNCPFIGVRASTAVNMNAMCVNLRFASTTVTATRFSTAASVSNRFEMVQWSTGFSTGAASTSVGSGLVYGNLLSGHVRSPVNRAHYIMQGSA